MATITPTMIVTQARTWLGTRFQHQGRVKCTSTHPGGCDCIGLIAGVARELSIPSPILLGKCLAEHDQLHYSRLPDGVLLEQALSNLLININIEEIRAGDILLFRFDGNPQHVGMVTDYPDGQLGLIHCYAQARKVVEHYLDAAWRERAVKAYRFRL